MSCAVHPILQCVAFAATWPCNASIRYPSEVTNGNAHVHLPQHVPDI